MKRCEKKCIEEHFNNIDSQRTWQGIKTITDYASNNTSSTQNIVSNVDSTQNIMTQHGPRVGVEVRRAIVLTCLNSATIISVPKQESFEDMF